MKKNVSEKYNIIFIVLLFIIPVISLNVSYYFITNIKIDWAKKEQEKLAVHEVETLASEADFSNLFSMLFNRFFSELKSDVSSLKNDSFFTKRITRFSEKIFEEPFPQSYSLYAFKLATDTHSVELLFSKGNNKIGKRVLGKSFEELYKINSIPNYSLSNNSEKILKQLLGDFSEIEVISKELRGLPTHTNGIHKNSWFIWDYDFVERKGIVGVFLFCPQIPNCNEIGRLFALKNLRKRKIATGAFLPLYKEYGNQNILYPLNKSNTFNNWANSITIQKEEDIEKWLYNSLPQNVNLGNYIAFTYLARGATHIAVVLVKSVNGFTFPKWLIHTNLVLFIILSLILYLGIFFNYWLRISLKVRFILSYILASIMPLSILVVTAHSYLLQYENNYANQTKTELETSLKNFDLQKLSILKDYRTAFTKSLSDEKLIEIIQNNGIEKKLAAQRVLDIFEKSDLPVIGVKILDCYNNGAQLKGSTITDSNFDRLIESYSFAQSKILQKFTKTTSQISSEKINDKGKLVADSYESVAGISLQDDIVNRVSIPIAIQIGNYCIYQMFDTIKIDNEIKYILSVFWDDKSLDNKIIGESIKNLSIKDNNKNFMAFRIKGQDIRYLGKPTRYFTNEFIHNLQSYVLQCFISKKTDTLEIDGKTVVLMPSIKFSNIVFVGWVNNYDIIKSLFIRKNIFTFFIILSVFIILLCSINSSKIFIKPIGFLKEALNEISNGNLNISINNKPKNEIGNLANEFSNMLDDLKEKERLSKLISEQAVQALQRKSNGLLNDTEIFNGVALVSDIRNFTGMSETYEPMMITDLLNEHFAEMAKIISDNGGQIYKFIGDAIEAVFPEKKELEPAYYRAFKAGCRMIAKLTYINAKRRRKKLFTYKIGVGLSYGNFSSGSVGSLETRLDYAILGEPLKKAAKLEALSTQNPEFPIVSDEFVSKKMANYGMGFRRIDSKNNNFSAYTIDEIGDNTILSKSLNIFSNKETKTENKENNIFEKKSYYLQKERTKKDDIKLSFTVCLVALLSSVFISLAINFIYSSSFDNLKIQSDKECSRLVEQLHSDNALKSAFETICSNFSEDIREIINTTNSPVDAIKKIETKKKEFDSNGYIIPNYRYQLSYNNYLGNINYRDYKGITNKIKSDYYRQANLKMYYNKKMWVYYNSIKQKNDLLCIMPVDYASINLPKYFTVLAEKGIMMALNHKDTWEFSLNFSEEYKNSLKDNYKNTELIKDKGYYLDKVLIDNKIWTVYVITKDLIEFDKKPIKFNPYYFALLAIMLFIITVFIKQFTHNLFISISTRLRLDILLSALLPILIFIFLSFLYVNEDYNLKKSEMILNINQKINEVEINELYFKPYVQSMLNNIGKDELFNVVYEANKLDENTLEFKNYKKNIKTILNKIIGNNSYKYKHKNLHFVFHEILLLSKNNWMVASNRKRKNDDGTDLSEFAKNFSPLLRLNYFNKTNSDFNIKEFKDETYLNELLQILKANLGGEFAIILLNYPSILNIINLSYTSLGVLVSPLPNFENPECVLFALVRFEQELLVDVCSKKNNTDINIKTHIDSGSVDDKIFLFNTWNTDNNNISNCLNDGNNSNKCFDIEKEYLHNTYWINSCFIPVSRKINLHGEHFLEMRRGNYLNDKIFAGISSVKAVYNKAYSNLPIFGLFILFSLILIFIIANSIIADLLAPVKQLIEGAKSASSENYSYRTNFDRGDELSDLCYSFNKMMKSLEEKQLMDRMVSKTALRVSANEKDVVSKKVDVVLLYVSIPGFDDIMKNTPTFDLFINLKKHISTIAELVLKSGGDIDKIMGDKLLIAFHDEQKSLEELAVSACKTALAIESSEKLKYKIAVGVNSGQVISGFLGVGEKRDYTIIGDPVNVTARIAVFAEQQDSNKLIISENIKNLVQDKIKTKEYGEVLFKGKSLPAKVYKIE